RGGGRRLLCGGLLCSLGGLFGGPAGTALFGQHGVICLDLIGRFDLDGGGLFHLVDEKQVRKRLVVMRVGAVGVVVVLGGFPLGLAGLVGPAPQVAGQGRFLAAFDLQALLLPLVVGVE